jgi:hypothetical protein
LFGWSEKVEGLLQLLECPNNTFRTTFGLNGRLLVEKHGCRACTQDYLEVAKSVISMSGTDFRN